MDAFENNIGLIRVMAVDVITYILAHGDYLIVDEEEYPY